jgi:crotonobetainyl-CoA:carnitine CoA-transferase CaiB-like acyl-CoA transferase
LIYCSVTRFGQTGPYAKRTGYDFMIQGMAGIMDLTGEPDGDPQKVGFAFADVFTGLYGVIGILSAVREREVSGLGQQIDMSLFDCIMGVLANQSMNYLASGILPKRLGNAHPNIVPYQSCPTKDGYIIIACGNNRQFGKLCSVLKTEKLAENPNFPSNPKRVENREPLKDLCTIQDSLGLPNFVCFRKPHWDFHGRFHLRERASD